MKVEIDVLEQPNCPCGERRLLLPDGRKIDLEMPLAPYSLVLVGGKLYEAVPKEREFTNKAHDKYIDTADLMERDVYAIEADQGALDL